MRRRKAPVLRYWASASWVMPFAVLPNIVRNSIKRGTRWGGATMYPQETCGEITEENVPRSAVRCGARAKRAGSGWPMWRSSESKSSSMISPAVRLAQVVSWVRR